MLVHRSLSRVFLTSWLFLTALVIAFAGCSSRAFDGSSNDDGAGGDHSGGSSSAGGEDAGGASSGGSEPEDECASSKDEECAPALLGLESSTGDLRPEWDAATSDYAIALSIRDQTIELTPTARRGVHIEIEGDGAKSGEAWKSGVLPLGKSEISIVVSRSGWPSRTYVLEVTRGRHEAYLKASNTGGGDKFGGSVALSRDGNTLAVGVTDEDSDANGVDGNQSDDSVPEAGAVYVFVRQSGGTWAQQAYLKASSSSQADRFGGDVALSADGNTLAVGASNEDSNATGVDGNQNDNSAPEAGAVYVFTRSGGAWSQQAFLKASNSGAGDLFGVFVALSDAGTTLAVAAYFEDSNATGIGGNQFDNSASNAGAVYVFTRSGSTWSQQAYLKASNTQSDDVFGRSVALSADGSTLAVGANGEDSNAIGVGGDPWNNTASASGAVYVFTRSGSTWSQQAYVKASNTGASDEYGASVALSASGDVLAVGSLSEKSGAVGVDGDQSDTSAPFSGAVYVYGRASGTWSQRAYVKASIVGEMQFGRDVALSADGKYLAVGAPFEDGGDVGIGVEPSEEVATNSGAVFVFGQRGGVWAQDAYVKATNTGGGDSFGFSLALSGDGSTLVVGASQEDSHANGINGDGSNDGSIDSGAVYVFR